MHNPTFFLLSHFSYWAEIEYLSYKKSFKLFTWNSSCDSAGIQTRNLLIRSQMLYSVELRSQT